MIMDSTRPISPAAMRIQPTVWMLRPLAEPVTANARIAPAAMRRMLTGIPMCGSYPPRIQKERARQTALSPGRVRGRFTWPGVGGFAADASSRVLLERFDAESRAHERCHDLSEPPEPFGEVVVVPALQPVDAERDRM